MLRFLVLLCAAASLPAQPALPPLREQASTQQEWVKLRLDRVLPPLMRKHGVAMWLIVSREYNEDPVFFSLVAPTTFAARRRTIYVLFDRGPAQGVERLALGGNSQGGLFTVYRDPAAQGRELLGDTQWKLLRTLIDERNPKNIAIDISQTHAFADGLSAGEREQLEDALGAENRAKLVRAELLALEYVETRLPEMMPAYRRMMENAHSLIGRAFSSGRQLDGQRIFCKNDVFKKKFGNLRQFSTKNAYRKCVFPSRFSKNKCVDSQNAPPNSLAT